MSTLIVGAGLVIVIALAGYGIYRMRKKGNASCSGGCTGCAMGDTCKQREK